MQHIRRVRWNEDPDDGLFAAKRQERVAGVGGAMVQVRGTLTIVFVAALNEFSDERVSKPILKDFTVNVTPYLCIYIEVFAESSARGLVKTTGGGWDWSTECTGGGWCRSIPLS
jgi:hypothetical protein